MSAVDRKALLDKIRAQVDKKRGARAADPTKFLPPKIKDPKEVRDYYFIVLPPLEEGDTVAGGGTATAGMDMVYFLRAGTHWLEDDKKSVPCPRLFQDGECPMCKFGFDLMGGVEDKKMRSEIAKQFLSRELSAMNIFFPAIDGNPDELKGTVKWFPCGIKHIVDHMDDCLGRNEEEAIDPNKDPEAWGFFYPMADAETPEERVCYIYHMQVKIKEGTKWNTYEKSKFIVRSRKPIDEYLPEGKSFQDLLNERVDLWTKYPDREQAHALLEKAVATAIRAKSGADNEYDDDDSVVRTPQNQPLNNPSGASGAAENTPDPLAKSGAGAAEPTAAAASSAPKRDPKLDDLVSRIQGKK